MKKKKGQLDLFDEVEGDNAPSSAPAQTGDVFDEITPSEKPNSPTGNVPRRTPNGQPIYEPTSTAKEILKGLPGVALDTATEALKNTEAAGAHMVSGAIKGATEIPGQALKAVLQNQTNLGPVELAKTVLGKEGRDLISKKVEGGIDISPSIEKTALGGADINKNIAEGTGKFLGAAVPISGISQAVGTGLEAAGLLKGVKPILSGLVQSGISGAIYGASRKPDEEGLANRAHNALDDAATFIVLTGAGHLFDQAVQAVGLGKTAIYNSLKSDIIDTFIKKGATPEQAQAMAEAGLKEAVDKGGGWGEVKASDLRSARKAVRAGQKIVIGEAGEPTPPEVVKPAGLIESKGVQPVPPTPAEPPPVMPKTPVGEKTIGVPATEYLQSRFPTLAQSILGRDLPLTQEQLHDVLLKATAAGEEVLLQGGTPQDSEIAATKAFSDAAKPHIQTNQDLIQPQSKIGLPQAVVPPRAPQGVGQKDLFDEIAPEPAVNPQIEANKQLAREAAQHILKANKINDQAVVNVVDHIVADNEAFKAGYNQDFDPTRHVIRGETITPIDKASGDRLQTVINLADGSGPKTGRHEAFHAVSNILLDEGEKQVLLDHFGDMEKIADAFAGYRDGTRPAGAFQRIFEKIKQFLERLKNYLKNKKFSTAEDIFGAIDRGEMGARVKPITEAPHPQYSSAPNTEFSKQLESKAIQKFGTTDDFEKAGFVMPDGKMLDFTQGGPTRSNIHLDVAEVFKGTGIVDDEYSLLQKFLRDTKSVRLSQYKRGNGIHVSMESHGPLSREQLKQVGEYFDTHPTSEASFHMMDEFGKMTRNKSVDQPTGEDVAKFFNGTSQYSAEERKKIERGLADELRDSATEIGNIVSPSKSAPLAASIMRENLGKMARSFDKAEASFEKTHAYFSKQSNEANIDFIDRMEHGAKQATPELDLIAQRIRSLFDQKRAEVQSLGTGKLDTFIENYFPHIWEQSEKTVSNAVKIMAKRPYEGGKSFLKKRTIEFTKDGIKQGLVPVSYNPVDLAFLKIREMDKYLMAHRTLQELKKEGLTKFVRIGGDIPEGFTKIDDRVSTVMRKTDEGLVLTGHYYTQSDAARIINNYLSPGLQKSAIYRAFRYAGNAINQFQLGFSAFHLGFTSVDAAVSKLALAINQVAMGHPISAIKTALHVPFAPVTNIVRGNKLLNAWRGQGKTQADEVLAEAMSIGGGRARMDQFYATKAYDQMKKYFKSGSLVKGIFQAPFAAIEASSKPILEWIVPRQKLGIFADMVQAEMKNNPNMTHEELRDVTQKAWDSVDNRMGQLVYDNLFWNRTFKDLLMASVRSVGWNLGTIREIAGGVTDLGKTTADLLSGKKSKLSYRSAYLIALPIVVGTLGAIYQYLRTGKGPQELKDYFFPKMGGVDQNGDPKRVAFPSYMKDIYHYTQAPLTTITNKLNPSLAIMAQMLNNKDYYGVRIRNEDDPLVQQLQSEAIYLLKQLTPFGIRNVQKGLAAGDKTPAEIIQPFIGITPAPYDINQTDAEKLAHQITQRKLPIGGRTQEQSDRSNLLRDFRNRLQKNDPTVERDMAKARIGRKVTPRQLNDLRRKRTLTPLQRQVYSFSATELQKVYERATPQEKKEIERMLRTKQMRARKAGMDLQPITP